MSSETIAHYAQHSLATLAQPTFIEYMNLDPKTNPAATDLLSATNGVFQTGGVLGTLTL